MCVDLVLEMYCYIILYILFTQITLKDIDFMGRDRDDLQLKEREGMYPPHFRIVIDGKHTFEKATARLTFSGTMSDLVFDIPLVPPTLTKGELFVMTTRTI